jgi:hypothetical protein
MSAVSFNCTVSSTDPSCPLGLLILLNDTPVSNINHVDRVYQINQEFEDIDNGEYELQFVMTGKLSEHTTLDQQGTILHSPMLTIDNFKFEDISLGTKFLEKSVYRHDFNGTGPTTVEPFFGNMGCNGTVSFKFNTPLFLWLLENV